MGYLGFILGGVVLLLAVVLLILGYLKAPPDTAYIISGFRKRRILIGKAGWRIPFFERVDRISLRVMQVDVKTSEAVPTNEFINVSVDGVANVKVLAKPSRYRAASGLSPYRTCAHRAHKKGGRLTCNGETAPGFVFWGSGQQTFKKSGFGAGTLRLITEPGAGLPRFPAGWPRR